MSDVSPIKLSKDNKRKFFDFELSTKNDQRRSICFSPEKHKLISHMANTKSACEIKKFTENGSDELLIGDYSSVKKTKLDFEMKVFERKLISIENIINECSLFQTSGVIINLSNQFSRQSGNGDEIVLRTAMLKDNTDSLPITFGSLGENIQDGCCYVLHKF